MNSKFLLSLLLIIGLASCTTAYKSSQTPDDVYYSPAPPAEDVQSEDSVDRTSYNHSEEDREIRVKIRDRRWRSRDYDYSNHPYSNGCYTSYYYSPKGYYYYNDPITHSQVVYTPRKFTLITHNNSGSNTTVNPKTGQPYPTGSTPSRTFRRNSLGNTIRTVLTRTPSSSSDNSNDNSTPARTLSTPKSGSGSNSSTSSSSSSSSSSSGSSAPVRTFDK